MSCLQSKLKNRLNFMLKKEINILIGFYVKKKFENCVRV